MAAKNKVIAGDYLNYNVSLILNQMSLSFFLKTIDVCKSTVERYEVVDQEKRKSAVSAVSRAAVGNFIIPGAGLLAGLSARQKGVYQVGLYFRDGKRSLIEIDDKNYKALIKILF